MGPSETVMPGPLHTVITSPPSTTERTACSCDGVSRGLRPPTRPLARADFNPALVRSMMRSRSASAIAAVTARRILPPELRAFAGGHDIGTAGIGCRTATVSGNRVGELVAPQDERAAGILPFAVQRCRCQAVINRGPATAVCSARLARRASEVVSAVAHMMSVKD